MTPCCMGSQEQQKTKQHNSSGEEAVASCKSERSLHSRFCLGLFPHHQVSYQKPSVKKEGAFFFFFPPLSEDSLAWVTGHACGWVDSGLLTPMPSGIGQPSFYRLCLVEGDVKFPFNNSRKQMAGAKVSVVISRRHDMLFRPLPKRALGYRSVCSWWPRKTAVWVTFCLACSSIGKNGDFWFCGVLTDHVIKTQILRFKFV